MRKESREKHSMICPDFTSSLKSPVYFQCIYAEFLNRFLINQELKLSHCQTQGFHAKM